MTDNVSLVAVLQCVELLVAAGADVNHTQDPLPPPVFLAASTGKIEMLKILLGGQTLQSLSIVEKCLIVKLYNLITVILFGSQDKGVVVESSVFIVERCLSMKLYILRTIDWDSQGGHNIFVPCQIPLEPDVMGDLTVCRCVSDSAE